VSALDKEEQPFRSALNPTPPRFLKFSLDSVFRPPPHGVLPNPQREVLKIRYWLTENPSLPWSRLSC
jgi:hypothetical protein